MLSPGRRISSESPYSQTQINTSLRIIIYYFPYLQTLQMYAEFHCILFLLVNDFQGQWKKGVLGVQLPTLLADTDTQPLPFLTVLLLHRFLSNIVFVKPKTVLIFYFTRSSLKNLNVCHFGHTKISCKILKRQFKVSSIKSQEYRKQIIQCPQKNMNFYLDAFKLGKYFSNVRCIKVKAS